MEDIPKGGLPISQFLIRTTIAGVLLRCLRGASVDVRADLTSVLLEFTAGCSDFDAFRLECLALIDRCQRAFDCRGHASTDDVLHRVLGVIETRYRESNLTLRVVSAEVQLSMSHLSRLLNRDLGCSFRAHLNQLRVSRAQRLLLTSTLSIKEVAAAVGYRNTSQLDRHFRLVCATTPASYRRNALSSIRDANAAAGAALRPSVVAD